FNAVLSISNQYVTSSTAYPIDVDKRKTKRVALYHWSWVDVLTEAVVQREHRGVNDPDQAYILQELIRYLSDPRSGAVALESMGPSWTKIKDGARENTLRKTDPDVAALAARWDDLIRYLGLELTKDLGRSVTQVLGREERTPSERLAVLKDSLADNGRLSAELQVPDVAGRLEVMADLRSRQVIVSTRIDAPKDGRSRGRVSWLLRQLQNTPDNLTVEARVARSQTSLAAPLAQVRENPELLYPEQGKEIRQFVLSLTRNMGLKKDASKGSFIDSVMTTTKDHYADVLQNLRAWKATPPKLKKPPEEEPVEEATELQPPVKDAIEEAQSEMVAQAADASPE
ncbi:MAG: hypothetical protein H0W21_00760, partial [Actinobacteria bacterium]|nr:hypothetical protein [Actinomycetota bacterium]